MQASSVPLSEPSLLDGVEALLVRLGLGSPVSDAGVVSMAGRNHNWSLTTDAGHSVFVKKLDGSPEQAEARIRQCLAFDALLQKCGSAELCSPRLLGTDIESRTLVFELIGDARSAADLAREGTLTVEILHLLGRTVGGLHSLDVAELRSLHATEINPLLPSAELLDGIPLLLFEGSSAAELQAWSLMQSDAALGTGLRRLLEQESRAVKVPAHCDLRLDQFLISSERVHLTDFEEFRASDAARDVGGVVGDLLHRAILAAVSDGVDEAHDAPTHSDMLRRLTMGIEAVRPSVAAFWSGYRQVRRHRDEALAERVIAFAGWHLMDRLLAVAHQAPRLGAVPRAAAGIGRIALLTPAAFTTALGLTDG